MSVILSLDPGTRNTGWAAIEVIDSYTWNLLDSGVLTSTPTLSKAAKLASIRIGVEILLNRYKPSTLVIEDYSAFGARVASKEQTMLQGILRHLPAILEMNTVVIVFSSSLWKQGIKKLADAETVDSAVAILAPEWLPSFVSAKTQHEIDAMGLGLYYLYAD